MSKFKFVDICAGIGGFHQIMRGFGGTCVYAAEINKESAKVYELNYGINPLNDITKVRVDDIPSFDVMCAGFPCQAFSKAGSRRGFEDIRGTIFFYIAEILAYHKPRYVILENVRNLLTHDNGNTIGKIKQVLRDIGYGITEQPILCSPTQLGIPQFRERILILCEYGKSEVDIYNDLPECACNSIFDGDLLDANVDDKYNITEYEERLLNMWDEFLAIVGKKGIGFPIWAVAFKMDDEGIRGLPGWVQGFGVKSRALYEAHKEALDYWLTYYDNMEWCTPTDRKFEWQAGENTEGVWDGIIQFRPSGVRVKRSTYFQALVAIVQIPVIGKLRRRLTPREAARLQSFPSDFMLPNSEQVAFKQLGNSINIDIVTYFASKLLADYIECKDEIVA